MIPDFYREWLIPLKFEGCWGNRNCEACEQASTRILLSERFSLETKCCTYFPFLPNFTLGKLIEEAKRDAALKLRLCHAFAQGRGTPLGLFPAPDYEARCESLGKNAFGRMRELLCPFFNRAQGQCAIWNKRPGVCASYLCHSTYGNRDEELSKYFKEYLNLFEWTLAHETLWRLGYTQDDLRLMERARQDLIWKPERAWGDVLGFEEEFFIKTFHTATMVTPKEIEELMGEEGDRVKARILHFLTPREPNYDRVPPT